MRIFLAGAAGAIGRRLVPLLVAAGHEVTGTTRSAEAARKLEAAGIRAAIVDVCDAAALARAATQAKPDVVVHQITDLPRSFDQKEIAASYQRNARIRVEGTRNLVAAAQAAGAARFIVQSVAFAYAPGREPHGAASPDLRHGGHCAPLRLLLRPRHLVRWCGRQTLHPCGCRRAGGDAGGQ